DLGTPGAPAPEACQGRLPRPRHRRRPPRGTGRTGRPARALTGPLPAAHPGPAPRRERARAFPDGSGPARSPTGAGPRVPPMWGRRGDPPSSARGIGERTATVRPTPRTPLLPDVPWAHTRWVGPPRNPGRQSMALTTRRRALTTLGAAVAGT